MLSHTQIEENAFFKLFLSNMRIKFQFYLVIDKTVHYSILRLT